MQMTEQTKLELAQIKQALDMIDAIRETIAQIEELNQITS